jgi:hypothetical protein
VVTPCPGSACPGWRRPRPVERSHDDCNPDPATAGRPYGHRDRFDQRYRGGDRPRARRGGRHRGGVRPGRRPGPRGSGRHRGRRRPGGVRAVRPGRQLRQPAGLCRRGHRGARRPGRHPGQQRRPLPGPPDPGPGRRRPGRDAGGERARAPRSGSRAGPGHGRPRFRRDREHRILDGPHRQPVRRPLHRDQGRRRTADPGLGGRVRAPRGTGQHRRPGVPVQPEDVAAAVAFVVSDDAKMLHGTIIDVDGGISATQMGPPATGPEPGRP